MGHAPSAGKHCTRSTAPNLTHSSHTSSSSAVTNSLASAASPISAWSKRSKSITIRSQSSLGTLAFSVKVAGCTVRMSPKSCQSSFCSAACTAASEPNVTSPSPFWLPALSLYSFTFRTSPTLEKSACTAVYERSGGIPLTYTDQAPACACSLARFSARFSALRCCLRLRASSPPSASASRPREKTLSHAPSTSSPSPSSSATDAEYCALRLCACLRRSRSACMAAS
mmetsp:Transcript_24282/g.56463  ORF Transcript_24282/g.56463 Transcript_24282/m.56463 type:complete len:227 (-) Transcript_24282:94-774(-)